jgi:hypothetical protein
MSRFIGTLVAILLITSSQASTNTNSKVIEHPQQIVTPSAQGHVKHKRVIKSKVQRAVPFGMDDNDDDDSVNDDLATGYRRRDLTKIEHQDDISERVRWRLFLARQLAMLKYRELHG